jgi:hypothetical protein
MKSPWNLFSKLTSRRPPKADAVEIAHEPKATKTETLRVQLAIGTARPAPMPDEIPQNDLLSTTAIPVGNLDELTPVVVPITIEEVPESAALQNDPSSDETEVSVDQGLSPTRPPRSPRRSANIARRDEPAAVPRIEVAPKNDDRALGAPLEAEPASEAVTLDDEIKELRQQLAERLRMQNDQLRKMIARFDR